MTSSLLFPFGLGGSTSWFEVASDFGIGSDFLAFGLAVPLAAAGLDVDLAEMLVEDADFLSEEERAAVFEVALPLTFGFGFDEGDEGAGASESSDRDSSSSMVRSTKTPDSEGAGILAIVGEDVACCDSGRNGSVEGVQGEEDVSTNMNHPEGFDSKARQRLLSCGPGNAAMAAKEGATLQCGEAVVTMRGSRGARAKRCDEGEKEGWTGV